MPFETVRRSPRNSRKRPAADTRFDAAPLDPAETVKTRARRRLIGAVALALAAIVFVPMLFDRAPPPPPDDIALQIPDRDTPFEGRRGVPDASHGPLKPAGDLPVVASPPGSEPAASAAPESAPPADKPMDAEATKPAARDAPAPRVEKAVETKTPEQAIERSTEKSAQNAPDKPKPAAVVPPTAGGDDPRAIAALEGKSDAGAATAAGAKTYAVQVAAYAAPEKARSMRDRLVAEGLKSYVESVSTAQGLRTRVRIGPFPSREAADRARAKLKTMKLDGSVVPL